MARWQRDSEEDKRALIELVREEIALHREKKIEYLSSSQELTELLGIDKSNGWRYVNRLLIATDLIPEEDRKYRRFNLRLHAGKKGSVKSLARRRSIRDGKRNMVVDFVRDELRRFKCGEIQTILNRDQLATKFGIPRSTIGKYYAIAFDEADRDLREATLHSQTMTSVNDKYGNPSCSRPVEDMVAHGKKVYHTLKKGIGNLTNAQLSAQSKRTWEDPEHVKLMVGVGHKVGSRSRDGKTGIHGLSKERKQQIGIKSIENQRRASYFIENRFYTQSQEEGIVALALEKYLPGYKVQEGINFQIKDRGINNGGLDFLVDGEFLEWHPLILCSDKSRADRRAGDMPEREAASYYAVVSNLEGNEKVEFQKDYKNVLALNYRNKRQMAVDGSGYAGTNVALATNERELYDFMARHGAKLPDYDSFRREFRRLRPYIRSFAVKKENVGVAA